MPSKYIPRTPHQFALHTMIRTAPEGYELWLETTTKNVAAALWYTGRKASINRFVAFSPAAKEVVHLVRVTVRGAPREKNAH